MSAEEDAGDKPHDPTPRKLEEARRRGQAVRSQDVATAAGYLGLLVALAGFGWSSANRFGTAATTLLDRSDRLADQVFGGGAGMAPLAGLVAAATLALLPWLLLPALSAVIAYAAQRAVIVTGENLTPRLSRLSPLAAAKRKFGPEGLVDFAKSAAKLAVTGIALWLYLAHEADRILGLMRLPAAQAAAGMAGLLSGFLVAVVLVSAAIAVPDWLWQRHVFLKQNRMSLKELRDESKESEGDPHFKGERRRRAVDIATNRMLAEVPKADVVIVNPTHYAVALKWSRAKGAAPVCVAKGVDEIALRIREAAASAGVPVHRDPPTARALHATVELGREIRPEHYRAVAAAIRFAERLRARTRGRR